MKAWPPPAIAAMLERYEQINSLCEHSDMALDYPDMCRACEYERILDAAAPFIAKAASVKAARALMDALHRHGQLISDDLYWALVGVAREIVSPVPAQDGNNHQQKPTT